MSNTENALSLIAEERQDQIDKHGFSNEHALAHPEWYAVGQHVQAAVFALTTLNSVWPRDWENHHFRDKITSKSRIDQLVVAGALIVAEIERLESIKFQQIDDVEPSPSGNWEAYKETFLAYCKADGFRPEAIEHIDWDGVHDLYDFGLSALDAYKSTYYESH